MQHLNTWLAALAAVALFGCDADPGEETTQEPVSVCASSSSEYEDIVAGLTKAGANGIVQVKYVASTPAPPAEDDNRWTVQLLDMAGAPLADGAITDVKPWMPDHGHGTMVVPTMSDMDAEGMVDIEAIDFRMPGVWTLTFTVETAGQIDTATFGLCIE